jgi:PAS domain S-box-containing protein
MNSNLKNANIFQLLFEIPTEGIILCDKTGEIVLCNEQMYSMFRHDKNELIEKKVEVLIPRKVRDTHKSLRAGYLNKPDKRKMGNGRDLVTDISERKKNRRTNN